MAIWTYADSDDTKANDIQRITCPHCMIALNDLSNEKREWLDGRGEDFTRTTVGVCSLCGWWQVQRFQHFPPFGPGVFDKGGTRDSGAYACLKRMDLANIDLPLEEVRSYLIAKYEARHQLHPRLFEKTVASVFSAMGYETLVTAYSKDGGIDVILHDGTSQIGVQVKRYRI